jgi:hypothetical protein
MKFALAWLARFGPDFGRFGPCPPPRRRWFAGTLRPRQPTFARWPNRLGALLLVVGWLGGAVPASPHEVLAQYLQHRVAVTLGARHVDVSVELTFFEDGSEHEREHMDADGDGRLSRAETDAWLRQLEPRLAEAITLRVDGRPVALIPLRAPELDLLGDWRVGRGHHRLTLFFFASTPADLAAGAEVVVEDRLWPKVRALVALQVEGRDGARLEAVPFADSLLPPARDGEPRMFKARVLTPPRAAPAAELSRKPRRRGSAQPPEP